MLPARINKVMKRVLVLLSIVGLVYGIKILGLYYEPYEQTLPSDRGQPAKLFSYIKHEILKFSTEHDILNVSKSKTLKASQPFNPNEHPIPTNINSIISPSSNNKGKPTKLDPKTSKSKPEKPELIRTNKSEPAPTVALDKKEETPVLDYTRLDLQALKNESTDFAWNKQTEMEKKSRYEWRRNASDPIPKRPPAFQEITKKVMWIYSAFFVPANNGKNATVKGLGLVQQAHLQKYKNVSCHLRKGDKSVLMVNGSLSIIPEHHNREYTATWMICPLPAQFQPDSVSFTAFPEDNTNNIVLVVYPGKKLLRNFTVCHSALYGPFNQPQHLIHAWEIYRVLGADHIYVYNMDVSFSTERVLQAYESVGILTVLPWDKYPSDQGHYQSQLIAINDCVYRNRNVSKYVFVHDTDEIIVPHTNHTGWYEMVKFHESKWDKKGPRIAAFGVQSSFFCDTPLTEIWQNATKKYNISAEEDTFIHKYNVKPFLEIGNATSVFQYKTRSKNLIMPERVVTMGVHFVWEFEPGYRVQVLPSREAIVFHHRLSCNNLQKSKQADFPTLLYLNPSYQRLSKVYKQIDPS